MKTHRGRWPTRALAATLGVLAHGALAQAPPGAAGAHSFDRAGDRAGSVQSQSQPSASPPDTQAQVPGQNAAQSPVQTPALAATPTSADPVTWHTVTGPEQSFTADLSSFNE